MLFLVVTIFQTFIDVSVLLHFTLVYFIDTVAVLFLQIEVRATLHQTKLLAPFSKSIYSLHVFVLCFSNSFDISCIYIYIYFMHIYIHIYIYPTKNHLNYKANANSHESGNRQPHNRGGDFNTQLAPIER